MGRGILLGHHRLVDVIGQFTPDPRDPVAHLLRGHILIGSSDELDRDQAGLLTAFTDDVLDAGRAAHRLLQTLGDLGLHDFRTRTRKHGEHRDHRGIRVRQFAHRQPHQADGTEDNDGQIGHQRQNGPADEDLKDGCFH